jgi:hypothetical protein
MPTQLYNSEAVGLMATHFPRRNEPNYSWGNILSIFMMQQNLRFLLPMSSVDERGSVYDVSGQGRIFTNNGSTPFATDRGIIPYSYTNGTSRFLSRISEPGLIPTAAFSMMFWFYPTDITATQYICGKYYTVGDNCDYFVKIRTSSVQFCANGTGASGLDKVVNTSIKQLTLNEWNFIAVRFIPSTSISVWLNPNMPSYYDTNLLAIPAAIHADGTEPFNIFRSNRGSYCSAYSRCGIFGFYAAALTDTAIWATYQLSRPFYGVI